MKALCFLLVLSLLLTAAMAKAEARLNVVASTPDLGAIAVAVGQERVTVTSLARGTEDPHFVTPRPSFVRILNQADVLIEGGAELESGWLNPLVRNARNRRILPGQRGHISAAAGVPLLGVPTGPVDPTAGHVHGGGNPHFLLDPLNGQIVARTIAARFKLLDPDGADYYAENLDRFVRQIDERMVQWRERLGETGGIQVVTYHNNYEYFARRFGFEVFDAIEPHPGIEPSPRHVAGLVLAMRENNVQMIWMEPFRPRRTPARVAEGTGAELVFLPEMVGGVEGVETYLDLIDYNVNAVASALRRIKARD